MIQKAYDYLIDDPTLSSLVIKYPLSTILVDQTPIYESLIKAIVSQQLSTKAAETIYNRFLTLFGQKLTLDSLLQIPTAELRKAGLSFQKANYVKNVAAFFQLDENVSKDWLTLTDNEIIELLTSIKGVGVWTVQMLLIFKLNRMDVLPLGDLVVRNGLMKILDIKEDNKTALKSIENHAIKWQPYRSYVSRLMWASKDDLLL